MNHLSPTFWIGFALSFGAFCAVLGYMWGADGLRDVNPEFKPSEDWVTDTADLIALGVAETVVANFDVQYRDYHGGRPDRSIVADEIREQVKAELRAD